MSAQRVLGSGPQSTGVGDTDGGRCLPSVVSEGTGSGGTSRTFAGAEGVELDEAC